MPTEQQKKKTAQTLLQTAQDPGNPSNMARILGVAGEGLADFASKAYENLVPQSVEELAMEGSPAGKAVGAMLGYVPRKWFAPFIKRLKDRVLDGPHKTPYPDIVEEYIDRNPTVAANLDSVEDFAYTDQPDYLLGMHSSVGIPKGHRLLDDNGLLREEHLRSQFEQGLGPFSGLLRKTADEPLPSQYIAINSKKFDNGLAKGVDGRMVTPREVIRHEFAHGAQHAWSPMNYRQVSLEPAGAVRGTMLHESRLPDYIKPTELGARLSQASDIQRLPLSTRLTNELNSPAYLEHMNPQRVQVLLGDMNKRLLGQNMQVVYAPGSARPFSVEKIVLDR